MATQEQKAADALRRAAARISKPGAWTQDRYARNARGTPVAPDSPDACSWCAMGAVTLEASDFWINETACVGLRQAMANDIASYNDAEGRTAAEVADAMLRAADSLDGGSHGA